MAVYTGFPSVSGVFPGKVVGPIVTERLAENNLLAVMDATPAPAIKGEFIRRYLSRNVLTNPYAYQAAFDSTFDYREERFPICAYTISGEFEDSALIGTMMEIEYAQGISMERLSQTELWPVMLEELLKEAEASLSQVLLFGSSATSAGISGSVASTCEGLLALLAAESNTYEGNLANLLTTSFDPNNPDDNVYGELKKLVRKLPPAYRFTARGRLSSNNETRALSRLSVSKPFKIGVSYEVLEALVDYFKNRDTTGVKPIQEMQYIPTVEGFEVVAIDLMPNNRAIFLSGTDLTHVYDAEADQTRFTIVDLRQTDNIRYGHRLRVDWRAAVDIAVPDRAVLGVFN